ncbi:hypothetical protein GCM10011487_69240 [Steroidobacter agaridevorans]|uniref:Lipoprotein n=1 Tax=Steroidobacter agaridevorans TaxID=2695856 RepID=A0A829YN80_9GAMM|nr:hypothetical protein [Steroidobacter agaridevorans]GFE84924.1 hypothetical protein GCM10011487_69240 [Steroidobacter agaridevorans]GFE91755.1 hypothetical protein GCM10011488_67090 [Steroidobacter agaridevorans]
MRTLILAAALTLAACDSRPAPPPMTIGEIDQIVGIADKAIGAVQKMGAGAPAADVAASMREMYAAIDAARGQINGITQRIGGGKYLGRHSIDPLDVSACTRSVIFSVQGLESETMRPPLVMSALECSIDASVYFEDVPAESGAAVALAMGIIYPIALVANVKAGLDIEPSLQEYRSVNEAIIARLAPKCRERKGGEQVRYECAAYEVALSVRPKLAALADRMPTTKDVSNADR